ncbi:hypothetical protein EG832_13910, partial [bacterium]|nr:hypothetical protein [bacterium]
MSDFLDKAYDLIRLKTEGVIESSQQFETVFSAIAELQGVHAKSYLDLDNLEIVFGAIEMGQLLNKLGDRSPEDISALKQAFITLIFKTLEHSISFPVYDRRIHPPRPYDDFGAMLKEVQKV